MQNMNWTVDWLLTVSQLVWELEQTGLRVPLSTQLCKAATENLRHTYHHTAHRWPCSGPLQAPASLNHCSPAYFLQNRRNLPSFLTQLRTLVLLLCPSQNASIYRKQTIKQEPRGKCKQTLFWNVMMTHKLGIMSLFELYIKRSRSTT